MFIRSRAPLSPDGEFSEQRFREVVNAALANNLGNMLQRTLSLLARDFGGRLVVDTASGLPEDLPLRVLARCEGREGSVGDAPAV